MAASRFPQLTADDLRARWPDMPPGADSHAEVLLEDAGVYIRAVAPNWEDLDPDAIAIVACRMVKRSMSAGQLIDGASSLSQTAGPFNQQVTFANPNGDLYLTKADKRLLGIGTQTFSTYDMLSNRREGPNVAYSAIPYSALGED